MTTERADAPLSARVGPSSTLGPGTGTGLGTGLGSGSGGSARTPATVVRPPRGPGRETLPPPRLGHGARRWTAVALAAVDCLALVGAALPVFGPALLPCAMVPVLLFLHARAGLYRPGPAPAALGDLPAVLGRAAVCWCAAAAVLAAVRPERALAPVPLLCALVVHIALAFCGRSTVYRARRNLARRRPRAALVVGSDPAARQLAAALLAHPEYGMRPVGLVAPSPLPSAEPDPAPGPVAALPRLASPQDITRAVIQNTVRDAVFTVPPFADPHTAALLRRFVDQGSAIWLAGAAAAHEGRPPGAGTEHLWGFACRLLDTGAPQHGSRGKRTLDLALATLLLVAGAPVLLACALAVQLGDGPGVLFRQERIGRGGRSFTLLKFRTLRPDDEHEAATRWTMAGDARTSRVGRLLRRTSLDELPQLWNVLRGDMSLVGPRPERPFFVGKFTDHFPDYADRHRMPVGITGLAQVHGLRGDTSIEDRVRFDNLYIDNWSLGQDIRIMLRTLAALCRPEDR
ncbi:exopolysaccharide biosynthesis polyprenyl glycosylphosphotransferase [Streptomyces sp. NPDC048506]|uniref:exopolysaccharide biosynthesis polyprenyl glycosylphosphotransferase n=1 Tax=Streptomyces sp. NPDC048506 TaxID=3155028 RepID=UPI003436E72F